MVVFYDSARFGGYQQFFVIRLDLVAISSFCDSAGFDIFQLFVVFLAVVFFAAAFLVVDFFAGVFLAAVFLAGVLEFKRISSASSLVIDFGSRSFGILALFGLARPLPLAGLMAGPLIYGPNGPLIILISPQSARMESIFF